MSSILDNLEGKKIVLAAYGLENRSVQRYLTSIGFDADVADNNANLTGVPNGVKTVLGPLAFEQLDEYDVIFRSPPIRPDSLPLNKLVTSATKLFFELCPAPIIGVTGTKGKGTTCTLITKILQESGVTAHLVGNIGLPALDFLPEISPNDVVVYELSSFQLWDMQSSPHIAVALMMEADHLDIHLDLAEYIAAKSNICEHQTKDDYLVHHPTNEMTSQVVIKSNANKASYGVAGTHSASLLDGQIVIDNQIICNSNEVGLVGEHNLENICAAITATWNITQDAAAAARAVKSFKGLPMHTETIREVEGVRFVNDSFASGTAATLVALRAFENEILILGGLGKGADFSSIVDEIRSSSVSHILLIGESRNGLKEKFQKAGIENYTLLDTQLMDDIVKQAYSIAKSGDVVLLSPGCASFDMFENYKVRGQLFNQAVEEL